MVRAAARRFLVLLGGVIAVTVVLSLALGVLAGASAGRSVSVGLYVAGSLTLLAGVFVGNRGPLRREDSNGVLLGGSGGVRRATDEEREETVNMSAVLFVLGLLLLLLGVAVDGRYRLV